MKKILFLVCLFFINEALIAQNKHLYSSPEGRRARGQVLLKQILQKQSAINNAAARTTLTRERLIGQADYLQSIIYDSLTMKYSGQRGSTFSPEFVNFGVGIGPCFPPLGNNQVFGYSNISGMPIGHNEAPFVLSDTTKQWGCRPATYPLLYTHFGNEIHTYDASNNLLDDSYVGDTGVIWQRDICSYNSASNITSILELTSSYTTGGLPWDSAYADVMTYNSSNQLISDSESYYDNIPLTWTAETKFTYNYDASNNLVLAQEYSWQPGWLLDGTYTFSYYPGTHQLKTYEYDIFSPGPIPSDRDSFGYAAGINYSTYQNCRTYVSGALSDMTITTKHVNSAGLPDTVREYEYFTGSTPYISKMGAWSYNSYNDPAMTTTYQDTLTTTPTTLWGKTYFYYELYSASSVPLLQTNVNNINIYPNPATSTINISLPGFTKNSVAIIDIINSEGQMIRSESLRWQKDTEQMETDQLLPGAYWISVKDRNGALLGVQKIIKL